MHHTTRAYILPIVAGTVVGVAAFISILWSVDPFTSGVIPHLFFYLTLFLASGGIFTLLGIWLRKRWIPGVLIKQLQVSSRQALLLSLLITGLVLLQSANLLHWWVGITLVLFIITVEIFFNS